MGVLSAVLGFSLLLVGLPIAAQVVGVRLVGIIWLFVVARWVIWLRHNRNRAAPVGPLSSDEKQKARAKLLQARKQPGPSR